MRVDYYLLKSKTLDASQSFLLRLIEKIYHKQHPILMQFKTEALCQNWDKLLWSYQSSSFLAHHCISPFKISIECAYLTGLPIGINLNPNPWLKELPSRLIEIVLNDPQDRERQRLNYKIYQEQKFDMMVHNLS